MSVMVRVPTPLRRLTDGQDKVEADGDDLRGIIDFLDGQFPGMGARLRDETGELRAFVNVYINGEDVRFLQGLDTAIDTGDEISVVPAVAGG